jgi:hypothetical protein
MVYLWQILNYKFDILLEGGESNGDLEEF